MASVRRKCLNYPDEFCYICGRYILIKQRENITEFIKKAYHAYFDVHLGDQDKSWAPHTVCNTCKRTLTYWTEGSGVAGVVLMVLKHCPHCGIL